MDDNALSVRELIAELQKLEGQDLPVFVHCPICGPTKILMLTGPGNQERVKMTLGEARRLGLKKFMPAHLRKRM